MGVLNGKGGVLLQISALMCVWGARGLVRGLVLLSVEAKIRKYNISLKLWLEVESFINNKTDLCQKKLNPINLIKVN